MQKGKEVDNQRNIMFQQIIFWIGAFGTYSIRGMYRFYMIFLACLSSRLANIYKNIYTYISYELSFIHKNILNHTYRITDHVIGLHICNYKPNNTLKKACKLYIFSPDILADDLFALSQLFYIDSYIKLIDETVYCR